MWIRYDTGQSVLTPLDRLAAVHSRVGRWCRRSILACDLALSFDFPSGIVSCSETGRLTVKRVVHVAVDTSPPFVLPSVGAPGKYIK